MPRKSEAQSPEKRERLTLSALACYDDVLTDALIDSAFYWSTIRKNRSKYTTVRGLDEDEISKIILHNIIVAGDVQKAEQSLLNQKGLRKYVGTLRSNREREYFRRHLRKYINMYLCDCPFEVASTNRYTIFTQEACVFARQRIRKGDTVKYLQGTLVPITIEEEKDLDLTKRNFSIVMSSRKKTPSIFLGPARFANHDCNANGRLVTRGTDGMEVVAARNIEPGEEITVSYGEGYFGPNNEDCLCHSCEKAARNGWTSAEAFGVPRSSDSTPALSENPSQSEPYSFRRKRRHEEIDTNSESSSAAPSPVKKRKRGRPSTRLMQEMTPPASLAEEPVARGFTAAKAGLQPSSNEKINTAAHSRNRLIDLNRATSSQVEHDLPTPPASQLITDTSGLSGSSPASPRRKRARLVDLMETTSSDVVLPSSPAKTAASSPSPPPSPGTRLESGSSGSETEATSLGMLDPPVKLEPPETPRKARSTEGTEVVPTSVLEEATTTAIPVIPSDVQPSSSTLPIPAVVPSIEVPLPTDPAENTHVPSTIRIPGDYTLTDKLIAQPYDRWVDCKTCVSDFLQSNGYQIRRECPRCERHSKLYGFQWPKTENVRGEKEEQRVMDHRTVHRFLHHDEEKDTRQGMKEKRGGRIARLKLEEATNTRNTLSKTPERDTSVGSKRTQRNSSSIGQEALELDNREDSSKSLRRSGRWRTTL